MQEEIYLELIQHLDRLPGGFPRGRAGSDVRLLQKLFTTLEAELALHLTLDREPAAVIAARASLDPHMAEERLSEMARKGLIFSVQDASGAFSYQAAPMFVGFYEWQVNNLHPDLLTAFETYWRSVEERPQPDTIPQVRTIPVNESIDSRLETLTYEQVNDLVAAQTRFAVAPCICRLHHKLNGGGCSAPEETCLMFGDWADFYARTGRGRAIDRSEVFAILARADAANLVIQPSNSQEATFICCCCGCCCGVLAELKNHPRPADAVASAFIVQLDPEACQGCWTCLDRCQMESLAVEGDRVALKAERCIGCGLCVTTCPSGALTLSRKPENVRTLVPPTLDDTWRIISQAQAEIEQDQRK